MNEANNFQIAENPPLVIPDVSNCPFSIVFNEDCVQGLKRFADNYFDLAIVDPPYSETFNTDACADNKGRKGNYKLDTLNNHLPTDEYWEQLFRVSKNQIVWGANWYGKYFGVGGLVWFKDNTGNYSPCEYAYQSINNHIHHYQYRWNGMLQQNMKDKEIRIHPTQKPVALYDWILQKFAKQGDLILDTHLGSGSSRIAANKGGFNFSGLKLTKNIMRNKKSVLKTSRLSSGSFRVAANGWAHDQLLWLCVGFVR